jgi:hypothetical protein
MTHGRAKQYKTNATLSRPWGQVGFVRGPTRGKSPFSRFFACSTDNTSSLSTISLLLYILFFRPIAMAAPSTSPQVPSSSTPAGLTLTALKVYNATFKAELLASVAALAPPKLKLVGILGTGKDDAKMYAEVGGGS